MEVAAGAMSVDPDIGRASARALLLSDERTYVTWGEMVEAEAGRADRIDAVCVLTPPETHAEIAAAFLQAGIDVICEKPMTSNLEEARVLAKAVAASGRSFLVTHCYTGYPMVRETRALVRAGVIGAVRLVEGEFASGEPGVLFEPADPAQRHWRFRVGSMGKASVLAEVGTHIHNLVEYVIGQRVEAVSARLSTVAERREVYDNAYLNVRFDGGATGRLWSSFVAAGQDHGLRFRVFGETGSLQWDQEAPEHLWLHIAGKPGRRISRGYDCTSESAQRASRIRPGHPEGYLAAFGNLYYDFARVLLAERLGEPAATYLNDLPGIDDGVQTLALLEAATRSHERGGAEEPVP